MATLKKPFGSAFYKAGVCKPSSLDESNEGLPISWIKTPNFYDIPHPITPETILCRHHELILFSMLKLPLAGDGYASNNGFTRILMINGVLLGTMIELIPP
jgi:hypothetical protein